jgi:hypothetical protein
MPSEIEAAPEGPRRSTRHTSSSQSAVGVSGTNAAGRKRAAQGDEDSDKTKVKKVCFLHSKSDADVTFLIFDAFLILQVKANSGPSVHEKAAQSEPTGELKHIDVGDSLPSFVLRNEKGEDVDVAGLTSEKGIVMFLVPKGSFACYHIVAH